MNLNQDFNYQTLELPDDYEGKVTATLIAAHANQGKRRSVLYVHGFIDYFFHPHMAAQFLAHGYDFYALELRKYGRALMAHQHPNYCRSMEEYFPEMTLALRQIYQESQHAIILMGHSTGGLSSSLYMNDGAEKKLVNALVLNSPFLALNKNALLRTFAAPLAKVASSLSPFSKLDGAISPVYGQSVHKNHHGEWDFNLDWKPIAGFPAYFAWTKAVLEAQLRLKTHSTIEVPVLVMHASRSFVPKEFTRETLTADTVLNVKDIARIGPKLGRQVTMLQIKDAMHDIFLSKKEVREYAFKEMFRWLDKAVYTKAAYT
ncbi:alpha/beta hydrolase [Catalinimonas niigatensis]|uniref:alpha/beta hydrolase n=1 Tax=Catalinimonas niigatensis TaxID=1397264 RepID=UPI002666A4E3|nr:alpha/beta hydrolase [Catalinimonas niigatensis]WPP51368.1 alpha/beta hydrolase [Catalinimonas niigatensis]